MTSKSQIKRRAVQEHEGTVKAFVDIDWTADPLGVPEPELRGGWWAHFGWWRGPFDTEAQALCALHEWQREAKSS